MNIYKLQKINRIVKSKFVKNLALWVLHSTSKRYLSIYIDPILGCNLRCQSCYFSDKIKRKELNGSFHPSDLSLVSSSIFSRALRLQIGCGAEPTLYKHNIELIRLAKSEGVNYVSMTTNANLLTKDIISGYLNAGLDEMTISIHGVTKETYEQLMQNASFDKLMEVLTLLTELKKDYNQFTLRLNFTINNINVKELKDLYSTFGKINFEILQLRSLKDIGGKISSIEINEDFTKSLSEALSLLKVESKNRSVMMIPPDPISMNEDSSQRTEIESISYCYISPKNFWRDDFNWRSETFDEYSKRTNYTAFLFKNLFK